MKPGSMRYRVWAVVFVLAGAALMLFVPLPVHYSVKPMVAPLLGAIVGMVVFSAVAHTINANKAKKEQERLKKEAFRKWVMEGSKAPYEQN